MKRFFLGFGSGFLTAWAGLLGGLDFPYIWLLPLIIACAMAGFGIWENER